MSTISVIIPTYNRKTFLAEAVDSALNQSYTDIEVIVIDDGSDDGTRELLEARDDILYVHQEHKGVSAARNIGIKHARGNYIAFLDSDDYWLPNKLEYQIAYFADHPDMLICQTDEQWIRNGKRVNPMKKHTKFGGKIFEKCLPLCLVSPSAVMMHRSLFEIIGLFDESMPVCEDYDLWLRISSRYPIGLVPDKMVIKRGGHEDQLSKKYVGMDKFRIQSMERLLSSALLSKNQKSMLRQELIKKCLIYGRGCIKHGNIAEGNYYLALAENTGTYV